MILTQGVNFALLSMLFAGINDVIFKKYAVKKRSRGMYILGVGFTWAILQVLYSSLSGISFSFDILTIQYGVLAGILLAAANISLIEGLTHIDVSLGSTVYRLNTIGVVILSIAFLCETIEFIKLTGIMFGVIAVLLLYKGNSSKIAKQHTAKIFFWLVVFASLLRAAYGVVSKIGLLASADKNSIILLAALCWIVGGGFYAKYVEKRFVVTKTKVLYSVVSGILVFCIVNFLILALEIAQASIVVPIANMSFIIALLISVLMGTEKMDFKKIVATSFAAGSIVLLSNV